MSKQAVKPLVGVLGAVALSAVTVGVEAGVNPFMANPLNGGYANFAQGGCGGSAPTEASCGAAESGGAEGGCGAAEPTEGGCGAADEPADETTKADAAEGKCGEGRCGS